MVDYGKFEYNNSFHGSKNEKCIDSMLTFLDMVCELYNQKVITDDEVRFFRYELLTVYKNEQIKQYINFLKDYYKYKRLDVELFLSFIAYRDKNFEEQ